MKEQSLEGCPRCSDYDEVVEELKQEKDSREQKAKSELQKCEERHKKKDTKIKGLEKKILAMTIAAVVGGTIIGKEFIDEIASYIKSFNSVKDSASKLIGTSSVDNTDKVADNSDNQDENETEDIDDMFVLEFAPRTFDMGGWPSLVSQVDIISTQSDLSSLSYIPFITNSPSDYFMNPPTLIDMLIDDMLDNMVVMDDYVINTSASVSDALSSFGFQPEYTQEPNIPTYYAQEQTYVPESHAWLLLGVPLCFGRRRR